MNDGRTLIHGRFTPMELAALRSVADEQKLLSGGGCALGRAQGSAGRSADSRGKNEGKRQVSQGRRRFPLQITTYQITKRRALTSADWHTERLCPMHDHTTLCAPPSTLNLYGTPVLTA